MTYQEISSNKRKSIILIVLFAIFVLGLGYLIGDIDFMVIAGIIAIVMTFVSYFKGDKIALASSGAKLTTKDQNPELYRIVENLAITDGIPTPAIYIMEDSAINAFATGRDPNKASIAVTRGALEKLEPTELEGVIAHELSHVKNFDIRFMMLVAVLVGTVAILSRIFLRLPGRIRLKNDKNNIGLILLLLGFVLAILSPLIAELIKLAISRKREYLADASGALLTRYPEGLARALEKIARENQPLQTASEATSHLFFSNPFKAGKFQSWFSTHPPTEERIKRLREMGK
jgi:heat shock protein HtpX